MNLLKKVREQKGISLIEFMVVFVIIGILAASLIPKVMGVQARVRDVQRKTDLYQIMVGLKSYHATNRVYPGTVGDSYCLDPEVVGEPAELLTSGGHMKVSNFPRDPIRGANSGSCDRYYTYIPITKSSDSSDNASFVLLSEVELDANANAIRSLCYDNLSSFDTDEIKDCLNDSRTAINNSAPNTTGTDSLYLLVK